MKESIFYYTLFYLFLAGVIITLLIKRATNTLALLRKALIAVFLIHFFAYVLAGIKNIPFGWFRNFFYLLPVYFLMLFYFIKKIISNRTHYYFICAVILLILIPLNIRAIFSWGQDNLLREMVSFAAKTESDSFVVVGRPIDKWPFKYYSQKYNLQDKALFLSQDANRREQYAAKKKLGGVNQFILIQPFADNFLDINSFEVVDKKEYNVEIGPYLILRKIIGYPKQYLTVYTYRRKKG